MKKTVDLVKGDIFKTLLTLSIPILGTSFIQMAYSLVDMMWIGKVGSAAVAAVGTASFFTWFGNSLVMITKTGAQVGVSQAIGKKDENKKDIYIHTSIFMCSIIAIAYTAFLLIFKDVLIEFFKLGDKEIISMATNYLVIVSLGMICAFLNPQFTGIITASGNSKLPFKVNTIGLIINIVLDPVMIFGIGPFKAMGVKGAAFATVLSQVMVTLIFIYVFYKMGYRINRKSFKYLEKNSAKEIIKWGTPSATQNCLFSFFAMLIGRIIAEWGATPIAVQKVGSQIESISWMTADGFSAALTAFVGQNYGAGQYERVKEGYKKTLMLSSILGIFATGLLIFGGEWLFSLFINEPEVIKQGADYLRILGYSQVFMCLEITTTGAFFGVGKTMMPSLISTIFTGLRVPAALILASTLALGVDGVWWSISLSSVVKGILLVISFYFMVLKPFKKLNSAYRSTNALN